MNKKIIVLCLFLVLLVSMIFLRWDIKKDGAFIFLTDRLTAATHIRHVAGSIVEEDQKSRTVRYITTGALYGLTAITAIFILITLNREDD